MAYRRQRPGRAGAGRGFPRASPQARRDAASDVPPLVVIGIDGFRPDYLDRADVPVLRGLAERGVRGAGLIPPFPSKTFPSFTTIATGLWPAHHGIVGNTMDDPAIGHRFRLADLDGRSDPRWWLGEPIWATVERQGRRASGMFWPGDDVVIGGRRPSDWLRFDDAFPHEARVDRVLEWFARPSAERPALAMLYFSLVDAASHDGGPDAPQALAAAAAADRLVGRLVTGLERLGLGGVNLVVVSDHGMAETRLDRVVVLDDLIDPAAVDVLETGPMLRVARRTPTGPSESAILDTLRGAHPRLSVYAAAELPAAFHAGGSTAAAAGSRPGRRRVAGPDSRRARSLGGSRWRAARRSRLRAGAALDARAVRGQRSRHLAGASPGAIRQRPSLCTVLPVAADFPRPPRRRCPRHRRPGDGGAPMNRCRGGADRAGVGRMRRRLAAAMFVPAALVAVSRMARRQPYRWPGRVVVITGGSRGLGLVLARTLSARGAHVALLARDEAELARAKDLAAADRLGDHRAVRRPRRAPGAGGYRGGRSTLGAGSTCWSTTPA